MWENFQKSPFKALKKEGKEYGPPRLRTQKETLKMRDPQEVD